MSQTQTTDNTNPKNELDKWRLILLFVAIFSIVGLAICQIWQAQGQPFVVIMEILLKAILSVIIGSFVTLPAIRRFFKDIDEKSE